MLTSKMIHVNLIDFSFYFVFDIEMFEEHLNKDEDVEWRENFQGKSPVGASSNSKANKMFQKQLKLVSSSISNIF